MKSFIKTLEVISPTQYQAMYDFIKLNYEINNSTTSSTETKVFGSITLKTIARQGSYSIEITIN
jgi:hypothetical protein